jgi:hypothetical protein
MYVQFMFLKDRQGRHKVTLWRVRVTIVAVKNNKHYLFWVYVRSLGNPALKAHGPYYIGTCGLSGFIIFLYIIAQKSRFSEKGCLK